MNAGDELMAALRQFVTAEVAASRGGQQAAHTRYVTVALAATLTGLTPKAIRRKIQEGKWLDGREYRRSPDGGIFIDMKGYERWVENGRK